MGLLSCGMALRAPGRGKFEAGIAEQLLQYISCGWPSPRCWMKPSAWPPRPRAVAAAPFRIRSRYSSQFMMTRSHSRCEAWQASIRVLVSSTAEISTAHVSGNGRPKMSARQWRSHNRDAGSPRSARRDAAVVVGHRPDVGGVAHEARGLLVVNQIVHRRMGEDEGGIRVAHDADGAATIRVVVFHFEVFAAAK